MAAYIRRGLVIGLIVFLASQASAKAAAATSLPADGNIDGLRLAIQHLATTFGQRYPKANEYLNRLAALEKAPDKEALEKLRREALLANPLLDFDKLLLVRRAALGGQPTGLPTNWQGNSSIHRSGFNNEIAMVSIRGDAKPVAVYKPEKNVFVGNLYLHFDGTRLLFSSVAADNSWQVFEIGADGKNLRQVSRNDQKGVDNYDACYLPGGKIIFCSTACIQGVPCVGGGDYVGNLYVMNNDGSGVRRLCFDQDHNWCPTVLADGRVLFLRWEYSDTPHYFTRLLFRMNPDGTGQMALYGSNSYWPNSLFYARQVPGSPSKLVGIVSGHHGVNRMGELVLFDTARGQFEADGAVQRIPGRGKKVEPTIADGLVNHSWPKFLHPAPLSSEFFIVSMMPTPGSPMGLYLVDVFDNFVPLAEDKEAALLEPIPLQATKAPPTIPERVVPGAKDATVIMHDVYRGPGLVGVPRGTVKSLRVFALDFGYPNLANHTYIGIDGPWDVHHILGTVPVEADGSAMFKAPANTPMAVQPLDASGKALQVMRSWYTAMPGEVISCVGCHEREAEAPRSGTLLAMRKPAARIEPWLGPTRGFSFKRDVRPVLDHYCVGCHDGSQKKDTRAKSGQPMPDLRPGKSGNFETAYAALHPYVRRPGPESDYHMMPPAEYAANTSELIQMLEKGHHGVKLHFEAWQRLYTWIDLNIPCHGTWGEFRPIPGDKHQRRCELNKLYANLEEDPEKVPELPPPAFAMDTKPQPRAGDAPKPAPAPALAGWPTPAEKAAKAQTAAAGGKEVERVIELSGTAKLKLVLVPAGQFVMGSNDGPADERPAHLAKVDRAFWMGKLEITNEQYELFDPSHDSRVISVFGKDQTSRGIPVNGPRQPVVRVSWNSAMEFCAWLSQRTGEKFTLPTETQWEYACRAGTDTPMNYGAPDADFSKKANLADATMNLRGDWIPRDRMIRDGACVTANVGSYAPNAWGLHDMHGNAAEWTASEYAPYDKDATAPSGEPGRKVVRGGSWYDRTFRCTSSFRLAYPAWQGVYNVGFRVVSEATSNTTASAGKRRG